MSEHTSGPWHIAAARLSEGDCSIVDTRGKTIALIPDRSLRHNAVEGLSNRHVIAAAPDLLAACESMRRILAQALEIMSECGECMDDLLGAGEEAPGHGDGLEALLEQTRAAIAKARGEVQA